MEGLNPKTPAQLRQDEEVRRFLQGDSNPAGAEQGAHH